MKAPRRRRWNLSGAARNLAADRRAVPLAGVLGAVALLAALISEWQVTTVDAAVFGSDGAFGDRLVPTGVTDLGALGGAFLTGLFPLVATVVLAIFGPPAGRRWVRLAGLSVGGTLLGLLFAITVSLGDESRVMPGLYTISLEDNQVEFGYGRGLWCALAGVGLAMLALYLSGRAATWTWRRQPARDEPVIPDQPLELTVGPATPFSALTNDRSLLPDDRS